jgi:nitroimidazol reductase NimA-like FMN-containing flavoprotein (pyridoxamine 5'-phosphate oxidase superfamily)
MTKLDLSLGEEELEDFLASQRTARLATVDAQGRPQVVPLWFVWADRAMFLNSTLGNVTVRNVQRNSEVTAVVDDGESYDQLRGVLLRGRAVPADGDHRIDNVRRTWSEKYMGGTPVPYDRWRNRVWLRLDPTSITSWDFRKIPEAKARAALAEGAAEGEGS